MVWPTGKTLKNHRYTIQETLGQGRFSVTYLAKDAKNNNHLVVIKTAKDVFFPNQFQQLQESLSKEAVKLAKCNHPHIVEVKETFYEGNIYCIVMKYISGKTLDKRDNKIVLEKEALNYIQQIGNALIEVHHHQLLHRDIRPGNIIIRTGKPEAVLIDFGLALNFDHELTKTRTEELAQGFAAIECYYRDGERKAYTDIYSLGATLYELLTGTTPVSAIERKLENKPLSPPKSLNSAISDRTNNAILKAMELEASDRPQTVQDWLKLLGLSIPKGGKTSSNPGFSINWTLVWAGVAAIATLLTALGVPQMVEKWLTPQQTPTGSPSASPSSKP
ncbi:MAG: serine/threonine-protein kinase [Crocosphaera sp.]|nr:serine/threonine-protein kinase [Crocosphaera sp.]